MVSHTSPVSGATIVSSLQRLDYTWLIQADTSTDKIGLISLDNLIYIYEGKREVTSGRFLASPGTGDRRVVNRLRFHNIEGQIPL